MASITSSAPVLLVADVQKAAAYYRDKLGFAFDQFYGLPPCFCMPKRDGHVVMLAQAPDPKQVIPNWRVVHQMWGAYFWVDDVRAIYEEFQKRGAIIDYTLGMKPYGVLEFGVQDLDGHDLAFGQCV